MRNSTRLTTVVKLPPWPTTGYKSNIVTETPGKRGTSTGDLLIKFDFKIELKEPA